MVIEPSNCSDPSGLADGLNELNWFLRSDAPNLSVCGPTVLLTVPNSVNVFVIFTWSVFVSAPMLLKAPEVVICGI